MKGSIKKISLLTAAVLTSILMSCQKDEVVSDTDGTIQIGQFEPEVFDDLTIEAIQALETPFESAITAAVPAGGRVNTGSTDLIIVALAEILQNATFKGIFDEEERGLSVYIIKFQLADGSLLKIAVLKDIFQILKIEGSDGSFDYNLDPQGSFISLSDAFEKALVAQSGTVVHWQLELEEENKWEYEVHVETDQGRIEVEIDAFTGEVIAMNALDEEDEKEFEENEEDAEKEKEEQEQKLPENIKVALAAITDAELIYAEKEEGDANERDIWLIYVETAEDAIIYFEITDDTEDLIYAKGDEGPFDYDIIISPNFISLKEALIMVNTEMQSETYYWYYEQIEVEGVQHWAFVIKVKDNQGVFHKIAVDAITTDWLFMETFD